MPFINSTKFGEIRVDEIKYHRVLIVGDKVFEREYDRLTALFGTSHRIGDWEAGELLKDDPELVIIGIGREGMLRVDPDIIERLCERKIELKTAATDEAVRLYNEKIIEGKRVNALIHTTC